MLNMEVHLTLNLNMRVSKTSPIDFGCHQHKIILGSESDNAMTIKGELKLSIEYAIAKIEAEASLELSTAEEKRFSDTKIKIHGTLKKPIVALNLRDLMESLRDLVKNPDDYLSSTPMYYRSIF